MLHAGALHAPGGPAQQLVALFAGASSELQGAMLVNPYDVDAVADNLHRALSMTAAERRTRMSALRRRVRAHDVHTWARRFIEHLEATRASASGDRAMAPEPGLFTVLIDARRLAALRLLLDYDGTLMPFARAPALAGCGRIPLISSSYVN